MANTVAVRVNEAGKAKIVSTSEYLAWCDSVSAEMKELRAENRRLRKQCGEPEPEARGGEDCCSEGCDGRENVELCGMRFYLCKDGSSGNCGV